MSSAEAAGQKQRGRSAYCFSVSRPQKVTTKSTTAPGLQRIAIIVTHLSRFVKRIWQFIKINFLRAALQRGGHGEAGEDFFDDGLARHAADAGFGAQDEAVGQDRSGEALDVVGQDIGAA